MATDLPQFRNRSVTIWVCLDANSKVGLWYADEAQAMKQRELWQAIFPVDIPAAVYAGFPVSGSEVARDDGDLAERPTRHAAHADEGMHQPRAPERAGDDPEGRDLPERPFLDLDSMVDLSVAPENTEDPTNLAVTCAVAGLAIEHRSLRDDR